MLDLTVVVLTKDEGLHLARLLTSLRELDCRVVIVDSGSSDDTVEVAQSFGAAVYFNKWQNYARQFQWAIDNCEIQTPWVMRMDADEYLEGNLGREISDALNVASESTIGFVVRRKVVFWNKWIRWGGHYPQNLLRIWRRGAAKIEQRWMDEHIRFVKDGDSVMLNGHIVDENLKPVSWWIDKHNFYAAREAIDLLLHQFNDEYGEDLKGAGAQARVKRLLKKYLYGNIPIGFRSTIYFAYRYIIRFGFLDGREGFFYHFIQGYWYRTLVDLKVLELRRLYGDDKLRDATFLQGLLLTGNYR